MTKGTSAIPRHVAIIMDGNGRWAKARGMPRIRGHHVGADSVRAILLACRKIGVEYLTLYAFSAENWVRPRAEVSGLMSLLRRFLRKQAHELHDNQVRLRVIGHVQDLPVTVRRELEKVMEETKHYTGGHLILALSYGSRQEITDAVRAIAQKVERKEISSSDITEQTIAQHLYLPDVPDPDYMIRTSGEKRISNFLLWQLSYAELYVTDVYWPDFREPQFLEAIEEYGRRHRRFGNIQ